MDKVFKKGIFTIIFMIIFILGHSTSYGAWLVNKKLGENSCKSHSNCLVIQAKTYGTYKKNGKTRYDFAASHGLKTANFHILNNKKFGSRDVVGGMPRLCLAEGVLCLEHDRDESDMDHGGDTKIGRRLHIEGNTAWWCEYGDSYAYNIKKQTKVNETTNKVFGEVAYIMSKATVKHCINKNRAKSGVQGALWKVSKKFIRQLKDDIEGDSIHARVIL